MIVCESKPGAMIPRYQLIGCPYDTVSVNHLTGPKIGCGVHGVPKDRDLRMGITVWLIVCHRRLYALSSRSCTVWDFKTMTWLLGGGFPFTDIYGWHIIAWVQRVSYYFQSY